MENKIAALVILYNYDDQCIQNIKSYIESVDIVFAYDNSIKKNVNNERKLKSMNNIYYIDGEGNQGLSHAINVVAKMAIKMEYKWLITFDQDSIADNNMIEQMQEFIDTYPRIDKIGIISPTIKSAMVKFDKVKNSISYNDWVIQSGAMHNLDAYKKVNGYDEKLFIYQVDYEYCVRLTQKKYKIVKLNHAVLVHNTLDDNVNLVYRNGRKIYINKFMPMQYYYITRNDLFCAKKYKSINYQYYTEIWRHLTTIIMTLPYEKKKIQRLKAMFYGYLDYKMGKMGKTKRKFSN